MSFFPISIININNEHVLTQWGWYEYTLILIKPLVEWSVLNNSLFLNQINILGRHNSWSFFVEDSKFMTETQNLNIRTQLLIGIRYLDISVFYSWNHWLGSINFS